MKALLILGDQLFSPLALAHLGLEPKGRVVFMREDEELARHYLYHKHKLILFFTAMRDYADELREAGFEVVYQKMGDQKGEFLEVFRRFLKKEEIEGLDYFEVQDEFFELRVKALIDELGIKAKEYESPMFLTSRELFKTYLKNTKRPFMKSFYEAQRKRLKVLLEADGEPVGGQWSYDEDNRQKLPEGIVPPSLPKPHSSQHLEAVMRLVDKDYADNPGLSSEFWLPTNRAGARAWLSDFVEKRLADFGAYEDALALHSPFVFHSVLTPFLNTGLLTPGEVIKSVLARAKTKDVPLNSLEGFVRQVIGWREFVRGIYQNYRQVEETKNFWGHTKKLTQHWYEGTTGIAPLDATIHKCRRYAYAHHIERLMVVGSLMLLLEIDPKEAHRWFMEMFIDSADWVMGPNVYGMALFSDGGIFATKPYICGSNYYRKMGPYKAGDWQEGVDGLYWGFIGKHREYLKNNARMGLIVASYDKMDEEKRMRLEKAAETIRQKITQD